MKRLLAFCFLIVFPLGVSAQTVNVPIQNSSFEQLPVQDPAYQLPNAVMSTGPCFDEFVARSGYPNEMPPGWVRTYRDPIWGGTSIIRPLAGNPCNMPIPPDGSWMVYVSGSTISNQLSTKPSDLQQPGIGQAIGRYVLTFSVVNHDSVYPGYYEAQIVFGTIDPMTQSINGHELCSIDGWATQHFSQISFPCLSPDYLLGQWPDGSAIDPNAHLIISLSHSNGWPLFFDKVSLTFGPES